MKEILSTITLLTVSILTYGQANIQKLTKPIVDEGKRLYRSEMASWYGTDLFLEKFPDREKIGGYFSYTENKISKCIFFSKSEKPKVIGTISFDSNYDLKTATTEIQERKFTKKEYDLFEIRQLAFNIVRQDTFFKTYENSNLNFIPMIDNGEKKVYILTGPTQNGVVIFGNDYLLTFDKRNKLILKKQLHQNILPYELGKKSDNGNEMAGGMHNHLPETGEFITATDICTLMLYSKIAGWKSYIVVSNKYINIWDCETNTLKVIATEELNKINTDQEKPKKIE